MRKRLILGITGATGAIYAKRILEVLRQTGEWETHLVISDAGVLNIHHELGMKRKAMQALADVAHPIDDVAASIASGGFRTEGMIIAPCSMKTMAAVAMGYGDNLMTRAADVALKERRRLIMVPREAPLNLAHLRNMATVTEMGGIIYPPLPAFYGGEKTLAQIIDETVGRILSLMGVEIEGLYQPWEGMTS